MTKTQCFRINPESKYYQSVQEYFRLLPLWREMCKKVGELLGEDIKQIGISTDNIFIDISQLTKEENLKIFKKDGSLKKNLKKSKELLAAYKEHINELGLSNYQNLSIINFCYGVMRPTHTTSLTSFHTSENEIYYKADFDLAEKSEGAVLPITEVQYQEKYLEEIKKREQTA